MVGQMLDERGLEFFILSFIVSASPSTHQDAQGKTQDIISEQQN